jgi:transcription antitermination factor NusG
VKSIEQALFAGYLFCRVRPDVTGKIVTAPGVIRIVSDGHRPLPVPLHEIEALQRVMASGLDLSPWRYLQTGQRVRIIDGPLRGTEGIVVKAGQRDRLILSVSLLCRSVAVEIDPAWLSIPPAIPHEPLWAG